MALMKLQPPNDILEVLCKLHPHDVKASTALLNPNQAGSTQLNLSWIWQQSGLHAENSEGSLECKSAFGSQFTNFIVPQLNVYTGYTAALKANVGRKKKHWWNMR